MQLAKNYSSTWVATTHYSVNPQGCRLLVVSKETSELVTANNIRLHEVKGYIQARIYLIDALAAKRPLPDMVVLNLPYNVVDLRIFNNWLRTTIGLTHIPVVYHETALWPFSAHLPLRLELVDDVVDISRNAAALVYKAQYLTQILIRKQQKEQLRPASFTACFSCWLGNKVRRGFDVLVAGLLLLVLSPLMCIIAFLIRMEGKGPIFYVSPRAGKGYKVFDFIKFRTMVVGADAQRTELEALNGYKSETGAANFFKVESDPRVTRLGRFLRNSSLDELPQLFNVLKGDMAVVGNRPLPLYEAATLTTDELAQRFLAPAGITGLWQVQKRGRKNMSVQERIQLDVDYANSNSLLRDIRIMLATPRALFQKASV